MYKVKPLQTYDDNVWGCHGNKTVIDSHLPRGHGNKTVSDRRVPVAL